MHHAATTPSGRFSAGDAFGDARIRMKGTKRTFFLMNLFIIAIAFALAFILDPIARGVAGGPAPEETPTYQLIASLSALVLAPLMAGITGAALRRIAGHEIRFSTMFEFLDKAPKIIVFSVIILALDLVLNALLGWVGSALVTILTFFTTFAVYFILDRNETVLGAVRNSITLIGANFLTYLGWLLLAMLLLIVAALPLGIGLIWAVPFAWLASASLYAQAAGIQTP